MINRSQSAKNIISEHTNIVSIGKGILVAYIITLPMFLLFAYILTHVDFPEKYMPSVVIITTLLSILISGWTAAKKTKNRGWLNGGICGLLYMMILFLLGSIVFRDFTINRHVISMFIMGIVAGSIGGILGINLIKQTSLKIRK